MMLLLMCNSIISTITGRIQHHCCQRAKSGRRTEADVGRIDGINIAVLLTGCRCWAAVQCDLRANKKQAAWEENNDEDFITPLLCVSAVLIPAVIGLPTCKRETVSV